MLAFTTVKTALKEAVLTVIFASLQGGAEKRRRIDGYQPSPERYKIYQKNLQEAGVKERVPKYTMTGVYFFPKVGHKVFHGDKFGPAGGFAWKELLSWYFLVILLFVDM
jgi:hypothetical protein